MLTLQTLFAQLAEEESEELPEIIQDEVPQWDNLGEAA